MRNVTLSAVADRAGLATSNISRYFGTREEIYLELLAGEWQEFRQTLVARLHDIHDTREAVTTLAETLAERPLFCDLLSHLPTSLELNVSAEAVGGFKRALREHLKATGAAVANATELTASEGTELIGAAGGMAGLLFRAANPPPVLAQLYDEDPQLAAGRLPLLPTLRRMLSALAAGLPALRGDASAAVGGDPSRSSVRGESR